MNINERLAAILKAVPAVGKKEKGSLTYNFRGVDSVFNALHALFSEQGVFLRPELLSQTSERLEGVNRDGKLQITHIVKVVIRYHFTAPDGTTTFADGFAEAFDFSDKAAFKAQSMALKYVLTSMFLIPTQDVKDVEVDNIETVKPELTRIQSDLQDKIIAYTNRPNFNAEKRKQVLDWLSKPKSEKALTEMLAKIEA
jgi:hypothetical protein